MNVRTRLAPSPTGKMHIGTLRTALFDYFLAKQHGGQFVIRIEDTDQERFVPGAIENLLQMFQLVNISHDEGPFLKDDGTIVERGDVGPYVQSARLALYQKYADDLVKKGLAYPCFCSVERLDEMRKAQMAVKQTTKYDRRCLTLTAKEAQSRIASGEEHVIRMKVPEGRTEFVDAIRGRISFDHHEVDDCIIMKSDGFPTYYLACVVDDQLMNITHILRGEEWISSTPKSIILCSMLGWQSPIFAHVPVLLGPDKKKLSKRTGDTAVEEYFKHGYLAEAIVNFIGTLGFNPSGDREIFTLQELVNAFDLSKVNSAGAILNMEKLDWMNRHYLMQLTEDELVNRAKHLVAADCANQRVRRAMFVERSRISRMTEFNAAIASYLELPPYDASTIIWKKADAADAVIQLSEVREHINTFDAAVFDGVDLLDGQIKEYITSKALQNGNVLWPLRVALSGLEKSATPFELLWVLGKEESLRRIDAAVQKLQS